MKSDVSESDWGAPFEAVEKVGEADLDAAGRIGFTAYSRYLERAETAFLASLGFDEAALRELGVSLARVHVECDFYRPAALGTELRLRIRVGGVGVHSVRLTVEVLSGQEDISLASIVSVTACVDAAGKSVVLPVDFGARLRAAAALR
jgi:acyl-CoA thioester hydrolase